MLRLKISNNDKKVIKLYKRHLNSDPKEGEIIYGLYNDDKLVGYSVLIFHNKNSKIVELKWIYAVGYGKILIQKIERKLKKLNVEYIQLNVSIDPNEKMDTVMKRMNFYISAKYKVCNITFRKKYGPLFQMRKYL